MIRRCSAPFAWSACRAGRPHRGRERDDKRRSHRSPLVVALSSPVRRLRRPVERRSSASAPHRASVRGGDPASPRSLRVPVTGESMESDVPSFFLPFDQDDEKAERRWLQAPAFCVQRYLTYCGSGRTVGGSRGATAGGTVPPSLKTHKRSPRCDRYMPLPPAITATYCSPFTAYVETGALAPAPV